MRRKRRAKKSQNITFENLPFKAGSACQGFSRPTWNTLVATTDSLGYLPEYTADPLRNCCDKSLRFRSECCTLLCPTCHRRAVIRFVIKVSRALQTQERLQLLHVDLERYIVPALNTQYLINNAKRKQPTDWLRYSVADLNEQLEEQLVETRRESIKSHKYFDPKPTGVASMWWVWPVSSGWQFNRCRVASYGIVNREIQSRYVRCNGNRQHSSVTIDLSKPSALHKLFDCFRIALRRPRQLLNARSREVLVPTDKKLKPDTTPDDVLRQRLLVPASLLMQKHLDIYARRVHVTGIFRKKSNKKKDTNGQEPSASRPPETRDHSGQSAGMVDEPVHPDSPVVPGDHLGDVSGSSQDSIQIYDDSSRQNTAVCG